MNKMDVIVLAGGLGTRLRSVITDLPKPMAPINGQPFLHYLLNSLNMDLVDRIILAVGYKYETIEAHFGHSYKGCEVLYSVEDEPLGTGGAIAKALKLCKTEEVMILNGDTYVEVDHKEMLNRHKSGEHDFSIALMHMENPYRYGSVITLPAADRVIAFKEKNDSIPSAFINCGTYILNREVQGHFPQKEKWSFETDFMERKVGELYFGSFKGVKRFIDIGIPEDYERATAFFS